MIIYGKASYIVFVIQFSNIHNAPPCFSFSWNMKQKQMFVLGTKETNWEKKIHMICWIVGTKTFTDKTLFSSKNWNYYIIIYDLDILIRILFKGRGSKIILKIQKKKTRCIHINGREMRSGLLSVFFHKFNLEYCNFSTSYELRSMGQLYESRPIW